MLLVSEAIGRRNVAAIEPDRIQTRCRDDGAWAQVSRQSNRPRLAGLVGLASDLIGTLRAAYHVVLQRNNESSGPLPEIISIIGEISCCAMGSNVLVPNRSARVAL